MLTATAITPHRQTCTANTCIKVSHKRLAGIREHDIKSVSWCFEESSIKVHWKTDVTSAENALNTGKIELQKRRWSERAEIARKQGQADVLTASLAIVSLYELWSSKPEMTEPEALTRLNLLRKQIEASEQHRTMCVEHGLTDAAIDATYEIQELEKQLVQVSRSIQ